MLNEPWELLTSSVVFRRSIHGQRARVCGFDFDSTLVKRHNDDIMFDSVKEKLTEYYNDGYQIVIFSNECLAHLNNEVAEAKTLLKKIKRVDRFIDYMQIPIDVYLATQRDTFRKPSTKDIKKHGENSVGLGMFDLFKKQNINDLDLANSLFVGDAAGRSSDHSDADKMFAEAIGVEFRTPEEFFK